MSQNALIITQRGSMTLHELENGETLSLEEMQRIVGGYIEIVRMGGENGTIEYLLIVNEEGKLLDGMQPNLHATVIARSFGALMPGDSIWGDAILCPSWMVK